MTNKEAIKFLKEPRMWEWLNVAQQIAIDMAIDALSQEPCEDWYDVPSDEMTLEQARQAVKDLRKKLAEYLEQQPCEDAISRKDMLAVLRQSHSLAQVWDGFEKLPSVTPKEKTGWIPVSKRLPEEETDVLVCCETGAITVCCGSYSTEVSNTFIWYTGGWRYGKVVAWMPLPPSYQGEKSDRGGK